MLLRFWIAFFGLLPVGERIGRFPSPIPALRVDFLMPVSYSLERSLPPRAAKPQGPKKLDKEMVCVGEFTPMSKKESVEVLQCQICGHRWIPLLIRGSKRPVRCVNPKCRSLMWDAARNPERKRVDQIHGRKREAVPGATKFARKQARAERKGLAF